MENKQTASGVVTYVNGPNNYGFFNIKLEGHDKPYSFGKEKPKCDKGDLVEFEYKVNEKGYPNAVVRTLKLVSGQAEKEVPHTAPTTQPTKAAVSTGPMSKDDYWRRKEERDLAKEAKFDSQREVTQNEIRHQAARNAAIEFLDMVFKNGLDDTVINGIRDSKSPLVSAKKFLDKITEEFYEDTVAINKTDVAKPAKANGSSARVTPAKVIRSEAADEDMVNYSFD